MKKIYLQPAVKVVNVQIQNVMQAVSSVAVGDSWSSGEAASRGGSWDDEE